MASQHRRTSSGSTIRLVKSRTLSSTHGSSISHNSAVYASLWIHDDSFSTQDVVINGSLLEGTGIRDGNLIQIIPVPDSTSNVRDFQPSSGISKINSNHTSRSHGPHYNDSTSPCLCLATIASADMVTKQPGLQISIKSTLAIAFNLRSRSQVEISAASVKDWTASHVELVFRDMYLSRADMWRLVGQELAGKTVYTGQRITFLGTIRVTVKIIHVQGHKTTTALFSHKTVPVFRSEAARYVLFIQMSREMWDFDSEGNGEILFSRVVEGFLPDLFKRWTELEVRHLVSIVMFGRLEYDQQDLVMTKQSAASVSNSLLARLRPRHQDFYRVVVTDMASAQWTVILDELKKDFRVFLKDVSLHLSQTRPAESSLPPTTNPQLSSKIIGQLSTALRGNMLEAINLASTQFAKDYLDRDLIRTGISVVVITAGTGVFEVDRDMLNITSENLTNNGIGIDIVCLSRMPLHSVPLFKYRSAGHEPDPGTSFDGKQEFSPKLQARSVGHYGASQPAFPTSIVSSFASGNTKFLSRFAASLSFESNKAWSLGVPHWIDLSYWSTNPHPHRRRWQLNKHVGKNGSSLISNGHFEPRVRMYEIQMMGLMELGMADITIPYMNESQNPWLDHYDSHRYDRRRSREQSRSLSPAVARKMRSSKRTSEPGQGLLSSQAKALGDVFNRMDEYDAAVFKSEIEPVTKKTSRKSELKSKSLTKLRHETPSASPSREAKKRPTVSEDALRPVASSIASYKTARKSGSDIVNARMTTKKDADAAKAARNASYALRGLAPLLRAPASTEVNIENVQAQPPSGRLPIDQSPTSKPAASVRSHRLSNESKSGEGELLRPTSRLSNLTSSERLPSQPIQIRSSNQEQDGQQPRQPVAVKSQVQQIFIPSVSKSQATHQDRIDASDKATSSSSDEQDDAAKSDLNSLASSVPRSNLPFIRNVNASNPLKNDPNKGNTFGRWQHLYPRKPRAATVKWRSLCTPASVPLTTEYFPSADDLETEYISNTYLVTLETTNDMLEVPESRDQLFQEMLSIRFSAGYQLAVGSSLDFMYEAHGAEASFFFTPNCTRKDGQFVYMSMGNSIHRIALEGQKSIRVTRLIRKLPEIQPPLPRSMTYNPNIRTILSDDYQERTMEIKGFSEQYPWEAADAYLADPKKRHVSDIQKLRFWRARYVLLPVEPPAGAFRSHPSQEEENEEEVHLRGIRALTQMWQKSRYIPPDERRPALNRVSVRKKDNNPLQINLETLNPSELVATELDKLLAAEEAGDMSITQLLPEEQQLDRETATLTKVAHAMQGDRGIEIKHRRWHIAVWYYCFRGEEFTNWLVLNFKDIDTREEAEEFGNELMTEGLFSHVSNRHRFKDGNYFYTIKPDYRVSRPDLAKPDLRSSLFFGSRRSDRSVPPTPVTEQNSREAAFNLRSRSGSNLVQQGNPTTGSELGKTLSEKKRLAITLSKMIRIDVDTRKRSDRPEIVNLHYDRLHNPENCYHLELAWLNVTSKLVDDAIVAWTTQAEKYGLKLVEVPIAEARLVPENEPFRRPYRVKLALEPPSRSIATTVLTATSFTPQTSGKKDAHYFQKALLKRFNFVLDVEGVSEFPDNVEILYSWGKLNYEHTQFVHRSGVLLAQITREGEFLLLANRLYNARQASNRDASGHRTHEARRQTAPAASSHLFSSTYNLRNPHFPTMSPSPVSANSVLSPRVLATQLPAPPPMQASGILGLNVQSPSTTASPIVRPIHNIIHTADVFGPSIIAASSSSLATTATQSTATITGLAGIPGSSRNMLAPIRSNTSTYVTPESIKDDFESFCHSKRRLEIFYRELLSLEQRAAQSTQIPTQTQTPTTTQTHTPSSQLSQPHSSSHHHHTPDKEQPRKKSSGATGSSLLRPYIPPDDEHGLNLGNDDDDDDKFELPPAVVTPAVAARARNSLSAASAVSSRHGSGSGPAGGGKGEGIVGGVGIGGNGNGNGNGTGNGTPDKESHVAKRKSIS